MGRLVLPQMLCPTSDALWNIGSEFAGGEGEMASWIVGLLYFYTQKIPFIKPDNFSLWGGWIGCAPRRGKWPASCWCFTQGTGGKAKSTSWIWKLHLFQLWLCLRGCLLKAEEPRGCWWAESRSCAGQQAGLLPTSKPWLNCDLLPSKLGSSHRYLPWINNLNYWSPVGQILHYSPLIFFLLSQLLSLEGLAGGGDLLPSSGFSLGRAADVKQQPQLAGDLNPPEVHLEGASAALGFKGQMWQHLEFCHELHLQKVAAAILRGAGSKVWSSGKGAAWLLRGEQPAKFFKVPWAIG